MIDWLGQDFHKVESAGVRASLSRKRATDIKQRSPAMIATATSNSNDEPETKPITSE